MTKSDLATIRERTQLALIHIQILSGVVGQVALADPKYEDLAHGIELFELEALRIFERIRELKSDDDTNQRTY